MTTSAFLCISLTPFVSHLNILCNTFRWISPPLSVSIQHTSLHLAGHYSSPFGVRQSSALLFQKTFPSRSPNDRFYVFAWPTNIKLGQINLNRKTRFSGREKRDHQINFGHACRRKFFLHQSFGWSPLKSPSSSSSPAPLPGTLKS